MLETGYAAVTYRAVAAKAGVTPGLVQYYFPTLDDLFVAAIRRRSEQNLERLADALRTHADQPLRVLWEYSRDESTSALTTEFLALGNHRKSIGSEIAEVTEEVRRLQLDALEAATGRRGHRHRGVAAERAAVRPDRDPEADPPRGGRRGLEYPCRGRGRVRAVPRFDRGPGGGSQRTFQRRHRGVRVRSRQR